MASTKLKLLTLPLRLLVGLLCLFILGYSAYKINRTTPNTSALRPSPTLYVTIIISGLASLWILFTILTAFGFFPSSLFSLILIPDLLFTGGFIAVAVLLRHGATQSCSSASRTSGTSTLWASGSRKGSYDGNPSLTCKLTKTAFSLAVAAAVLFALLSFLAWGVFRQHRRNRAFGPGPENGYSVKDNHAPKSKKKSKWGGHRVSQDTALTGTTAGAGDGYTEPASFTRGDRYRTPAAAGATTAGATTSPPIELAGPAYGGDGFARSGGAGGFDPELGHHHHHQQPATYSAF